MSRTSELEPLVFEKSSPGHKGVDLPASGVPGQEIRDLLPGVELRRQAPRLPELSEPEVVRHYTRMSQLNLSVDSSFYPLGSCTMKYNPRLHEELAALPGFAELHPYQPETEVQGVLRLMYELEQMLLRVTGMQAATLQPAAGAHGELVGVLIIKAYHRDQGEAHRDTVIVPDSAHGTNLASAAMVGYRVVELPSSRRGLIDLRALEAALSEHTAALMLTNPNTLGLFEEDILEVAAMVHRVGALCYYDGANLNAIMGKTRPGDMGMDVVHLNLHKTFSTPHGGGGPGAGPVAVTTQLAPYLPVPVVRRIAAGEGDGETQAGGERFTLDYNRPLSIGRVQGFYGNTPVLVRAYAYLLRMGAEGLRQASEDAVLNANFLRSRLSRLFPSPYNGPCMHEFVLSAASQAEGGVTARDVAKRLLDFGFHPPTVYFPLIVPEALMVEPTETESRATLEAFVTAMEQIAREAREQPQLVREAPHTTVIRRPDEALAARKPVLRWQ